MNNFDQKWKKWKIYFWLISRVGDHTLGCQEIFVKNYWTNKKMIISRVGEHTLGCQEIFVKIVLIWFILVLKDAPWNLLHGTVLNIFVRSIFGMFTTVWNFNEKYTFSKKMRLEICYMERCLTFLYDWFLIYLWPFENLASNFELLN